MSQASRVVRLSLTEATVTSDLQVQHESELTRYVRVPSSWVEDGSIRPSYSFAIDWKGLQSGQTLLPIGDRLHAMIEATYERQAAEGRTNVVLASVRYQLLDDAAASSRPWRGATCLKLTEQGTLEPATDAEL